MNFLDYLNLLTGIKSSKKKIPTRLDELLTDEEILELILGGSDYLGFEDDRELLSYAPIEVDLQLGEDGFIFETPYDFSSDFDAYKDANKARNAAYRKSLKNKNVTKDKAREIPFFYVRFVNLKQLSRKQLNWYLYWRTNFKRGNYLKTDPGYILIYATEIVDGIGWKEPQQGLNILLTLLDQYKDINYDLEYLLLNWIFDFCIFYDLPFDIHKIPLSSLLSDKFFLNLYLMYLEFSNFEEVDTEILETCQKYKFRGSVFYQKNPELVDRVIRNVLKVLDDYYFDTFDFGLFDYYLHFDYALYMHYQPKPRLLFNLSDTIFNDFYVELPQFNFLDSPDLKKDLPDILKFTLNELRKATGVRGSGVKTKLPSEIKQLITTEVKESLKQTKSEIQKKKREEFKLNVDLKVVDKLEKDFELNKERLYVEDEEEQEDLEKYAKRAPELEPFTKTTGEALFNTEVLEDELRTLLNNLDLSKQKVLKTILTSKNPLAQVKDLAKREGTFLETIVDEINETAYEFIGDELVELTDDSLVCSEEYLDNLKEAII